MDKANLIISIIVVLCVATAVAAYGIINNDNATFSDLAGMDGNSGDDGLGNSTSNLTNSSPGGSSSSSSPSSGSGSSSSSSGSSSGSSSSGGSGSSSSGSGSSSSSSGSSSSSSSSGSQVTPQEPTVYHSSGEISAIAANHIEEPGYYAGAPSYSDGYWYVTVYSEVDGTPVSGFVINDRTGYVDMG